MAKIGRNTPCGCGSGRKFKHCCGALSSEHRPFDPPSQEVRAQMALQMQRHQASEHRRRLMQGLGRPIISNVFKGHRFVAVGSEIRWSNAWQTFPDFLFYYINDKFTHEWGNAELVKSDEASHPLIRWYRKLCKFQESHRHTKKGEIYTGFMTGAVKAYLELAYHLYLSAHNSELPDRLLLRLRNRDQFEGAVNEAFVIACFAKSGFEIEFENEDDSSSSHCEFTAIHKNTKRRFSVEAKAITTKSKRAGQTAEPPRIRDQLYSALRKQAAHPRIIFIELGRPHRLDADGKPEWIDEVIAQFEACERELTIRGEPAPPAYVFVTNRPYLHDLDGTAYSEIVCAGGFKIPDYPPHKGAGTMLQLHRARERHVELDWLLKAISTHDKIPTTFDDRLPEEVFNTPTEARLLIGNTYLVPDASGNELPGVLVNAIVLPQKSVAHGTFRMPDGTSNHCSVPLSDAEMEIYRGSPETFFGTLDRLPRTIAAPLEAFDLVYEAYSKSSRDKLLEFMANWPQIDELRKLTQKELAERYSAAIAANMWHDVRTGRTRLTPETQV